MNTKDTINAKEIRKDLVGFLRRVKSGRPLTVIYRSKPFVTINDSPVDEKKPRSTSSKPEPGSKEAVRQAIAYAKELNKEKKPVLNPNKPIKELYSESMDEKYGVVR